MVILLGHLNDTSVIYFQKFIPNTYEYIDTRTLYNYREYSSSILNTILASSSIDERPSSSTSGAITEWFIPQVSSVFDYNNLLMIEYGKDLADINERYNVLASAEVLTDYENEQKNTYLGLLTSGCTLKYNNAKLHVINTELLLKDINVWELTLGRNNYIYW